jgi:hypothetical protein
MALCLATELPRPGEGAASRPHAKVEAVTIGDEAFGLALPGFNVRSRVSVRAIAPSL